MREYHVLTPVYFHCGRLVLTEDQARKRALSLKNTAENGVYEVVEPVYFIAGEVVGVDDINSNAAHALKEVKAPPLPVEATVPEVEKKEPVAVVKKRSAKAKK